MPHDSTNVLGRRLSSISVVKRVYLVGQKAKNNARRHLEAMGEDVDLVFHAWVIVEGIVVEIAEFRGLPLQGRASKGYDNVDFDKSYSLEGY